VNSSDLTSALKEANKIAPAHAQIAPELVVILTIDDTFPKASKGTMQRGKAYQAYASAIDQAYKRYEASDMHDGTSLKLQLAPSELLDYILDKLRETMQQQNVDADDDLFNLGLTSTQALRVRNVLRTVSSARLRSTTGNRTDPNRLAEIGPRYICKSASEYRLRMFYSTKVSWHTVFLKTDLSDLPSYRLAGYISDRTEGHHVESEDPDFRLMEELLNSELTKFEALPNKQTNWLNENSTRRTCVGCESLASNAYRADEKPLVDTDWRYRVSRCSTHLTTDEQNRSMEHHVPSQSC
jgi:hypothetical protein